MCTFHPCVCPCMFVNNHVSMSECGLYVAVCLFNIKPRSMLPVFSSHICVTTTAVSCKHIHARTHTRGPEFTDGHEERALLSYKGGTRVPGDSWARESHCHSTHTAGIQFLQGGSRPFYMCVFPWCNCLWSSVSESGWRPGVGEPSHQAGYP